MGVSRSLDHCVASATAVAKRAGVSPKPIGIIGTIATADTPKIDFLGFGSAGITLFSGNTGAKSSENTLLQPENARR